MPRRIESLLLDGPAGKLEALLEEPEDGPAREACLVCHPHPLYGGTMHNKVVYRMARALRRARLVVLRFNFRGVGQSQGEHAGGPGEEEDARAALGWLRARYPALPFSLTGFSFGARIVLRLGCQTSGETPGEAGGAARVIAAGLPTGQPVFDYLATCTVPKILIQSTNDQYGPRNELEAVFAGMAEPKRLLWIESADHFFADGLDDLERTIFELTENLGGGLAQEALDPAAGSESN